MKFMAELLFSYGTLQLEAVQVNTFGRLLDGQADAVIGYKLSYIEIKDEAVLAVSGKKFHPIITHTGNPEDLVEGMIFLITNDELKRSDEYEVSDYTRVLADLRSGKKAWVYVSKAEK
jgi:gamma-glutamylcyclotransferase (GGCT)/AIG2-like uncharacterized protein YtfP